MSKPGPISYQEMQRRARSLIAQIERDFQTVRLGGGMTLEEAACFDDYEPPSAAERQKIRDQFLIDRWQDVDLREKDNATLSVGLSFIDPQGFAFYLPAYMTAELKAIDDRSYHEVTGHLDYKFLSADGDLADRFCKLNKRQSRACARYFVFMNIDTHPYLGFGDKPQPGYMSVARRYWSKFLDPGERERFFRAWGKDD